jgi:DnaJ-class molecular chaperone
MMKKICPRCQGNGFIKLMESIDKPNRSQYNNVPQCNSEGEIMIDVTKNEIIEK